MGGLRANQNQCASGRSDRGMSRPAGGNVHVQGAQSMSANEDLAFDDQAFFGLRVEVRIQGRSRLHADERRHVVGSVIVPQ